MQRSTQHAPIIIYILKHDNPQQNQHLVKKNTEVTLLTSHLPPICHKTDSKLKSSSSSKRHPHLLGQTKLEPSLPVVQCLCQITCFTFSFRHLEKLKNTTNKVYRIQELRIRPLRQISLAMLCALRILRKDAQTEA